MNDCQLCYQEGTKYCEKYDDNRVIAYENFQDNYFYEANNPTLTLADDFPPDNWFLSRDLNNDLKETNKIWRVSSDENAQVSGHKCVCRKGYYGQYCNAQASKRAAVFMSPEAMFIIILCLITCLSKKKKFLN